MKYCKLKILAFYTSLQLLLSFGLKGSIKGQDIKGKDNLKSLLCCGDYVGRKELEEKDEKIKDLETKIQTLIQYYEKNINSFKEKNEKLAKELAKKEDNLKPSILPCIKTGIPQFQPPKLVTNQPLSKINNFFSSFFKN
jgi:uncharacterized phage infection (PIP) family protein YhgE